jgi:hypothetical protein
LTGQPVADLVDIGVDEPGGWRASRPGPEVGLGVNVGQSVLSQQNRSPACSAALSKT